MREQLFRPTYQNRLRVIGRHLDLHEYRALNLVEVGGPSCYPGFLVRALPAGSHTPDVLEFPNYDFPQRVTLALAARGEGERLHSPSLLLVTGYEDFLRALGHWLDGRLAAAITVSELDQFIAVGGVANVAGSAQDAPLPFQRLLRTNDITSLLDEAFRRRAPIEETTYHRH